MTSCNETLFLLHKVSLAYFLSHDYLSYKFTLFFIYFLFLSDEGPTLETLDFTLSVLAVHRPFYISINLSLYSAYAEHYVNLVSLYGRFACTFLKLYKESILKVLELMLKPAMQSQKLPPPCCNERTLTHQHLPTT